MKTILTYAHDVLQAAIVIAAIATIMCLAILAVPAPLPV